MMQTQTSQFNQRIADLQSMQENFMTKQQESQQAMEQRFTELLANQIDQLIEKALPQLTKRMDAKLAAFFAPDPSDESPHLPPNALASPTQSPRCTTQA
jgi:TolA-binding protein